MSDWKAAFVTLKLESPLHVGLRATGNLKQTRRYIPARSLWASFVERIGKLSGARRFEDFEAPKRYVSECFRFSYAFPSDSPHQVKVWPWGPAQELEEFDWLYLQSYGSTALWDGRSKEDGSLHETEYLAPRTRERKPVYLLFHLWHQPDGRYADYRFDEKSFWDGFTLGGDRGYGWGRVTLGGVAVSSSEGRLFHSGELRYGPSAINGKPVLTVANKDRALAHVKGGGWNGRVEPFLGRATTKDGAGGRLDSPVYAYEPGSLATGPGIYGIDEQGCWEIVGG